MTPYTQNVFIVYLFYLFFYEIDKSSSCLSPKKATKTKFYLEIDEALQEIYVYLHISLLNLSKFCTVTEKNSKIWFIVKQTLPECFLEHESRNKSTTYVD